MELSMKKIASCAYQSRVSDIFLSEVPSISAQEAIFFV
jgi:hypothetical protein